MITQRLLAAAVRLVAGVYREQDLKPAVRGRIYFANHSSHLDFLVVWAALPHALRRQTRPVAAADYWQRDAVRRFLAGSVFRAVLIARQDVRRENHPVDAMQRALEDGSDLIVFPEGTRVADACVQPFKSGLYHLVRRCPDVELVPVWLENLNRILPKGEFLPVPVLGRVVFGPAIPTLGAEESKDAFLHRCRESLVALSSPDNSSSINASSQ